MCDYTGRHFGANYEDTCCIEGYLWDLDSGDEDGLTSGGEIPCPQCNLDQWLRHTHEEAVHDAINVRAIEPSALLLHWWLAPRIQHMHGFGAIKRAAQMGLLDILWFGGNGYADNDPVGRITWPWPLPESRPLSAHQHIALHEAAREGGAQECAHILPLRPGDWT